MYSHPAQPSNLGLPQHFYILSPKIVEKLQETPQENKNPATTNHIIFQLPFSPWLIISKCLQQRLYPVCQVNNAHLSPSTRWKCSRCCTLGTSNSSNYWFFYHGFLFPWRTEHIPTSRSLQAASCCPLWIWIDTQARTTWMLVRKYLLFLHPITASTTFSRLGDELWSSRQSCPARFNSLVGGRCSFSFFFSMAMNCFIIMSCWKLFLCNEQSCG